MHELFLQSLMHFNILENNTLIFSNLPLPPPDFDEVTPPICLVVEHDPNYFICGAQLHPMWQILHPSFVVLHQMASKLGFDFLSLFLSIYAWPIH